MFKWFLKNEKLNSKIKLSNNSSFVILIFAIVKFLNICRSTFRHSKFWPPPNFRKWCLWKPDIDLLISINKLWFRVICRGGSTNLRSHEKSMRPCVLSSIISKLCRVSLELTLSRLLFSLTWTIAAWSNMGLPMSWIRNSKDCLVVVFVSFSI